MSTPPASRAIATPPHTLADVLAAIAAAELPERRKQDLASAVRSVARALGRPLEQMPADPRLLASRLTAIAPQALGFSKARWSNVRSLLRAALELVTAMAPGRHLTPLSPGLAGAVERAPVKDAEDAPFPPAALLHRRRRGAGRHRRGDLRRVPRALELTLLKDPPIVFRETLLGWNAARTRVDGWPDFTVGIPARRTAWTLPWSASTVGIPARRTAWTLPWSAFPQSLYRDVMRYLDRLGGRDRWRSCRFGRCGR